MNNGDNNTLIEEHYKLEYDIEKIKSKIYTVRGKQVMFDNDVAILYHCETKYVNRVVKRNIDRFPEEFCFQLTEKEIKNLRCQFVTSSLKKENYGGRRYLPYVFTEQGIAMLSGLLRTDIAIKVSINIMKAFIEMRRIIFSNNNFNERLTKVEYNQIEFNRKFDKVFNELQKSKKDEFKEKIFFDGQIYDAYRLINNIIKKANSKILIIDNYIDDTVLEMLTKKRKNVEAVILTSNNSKISRLDIQKFNEEYPKLKIAKTNQFHDRFIIIDDKEIYHCGASLKDVGKKCFGINRIEDIKYINKLISYIT